MAEETPQRENKLPPGFSHTETATDNYTFINDPERAKKMIEAGDKQETIKIQFPDGFEVHLEGFQEIKDAAGDVVLAIKIKPEKGMVLYYRTGHPDTDVALNAIKEQFTRAGLTKVEFRNIEDGIPKLREAFDKALNGEIKTEPGAHPNMKALEG